MFKAVGQSDTAVINAGLTVDAEAEKALIAALNKAETKITGETDEDGLVELNADEEKDSGVKMNEMSASSKTGAYEEGKKVDDTDGDTKDGSISDTQQHATGDCWLLTAVNALSYTEEGREIIEGCLEYHDGYTIVHLAVGDITISDYELIETKADSQYSSGDDDMIIFELAIEKVLDAIASGEIELSEDAPWFLEDEDGLETTTYGNSSTRGGWMLQALYYITGISGTSVSTKDEKEDELDKFIESGGENYVLTAAGINDCDSDGHRVVKDVNGKKVTLVNAHAYAIKSADEDTVTVINPWDSSKEIVLPRETFLEVFGMIQGLDLTQESNDGAYLSAGGDYTSVQEVFDNNYVHCEYDDDGNLISKTEHYSDGGYTYDCVYDGEGNFVSMTIYAPSGNCYNYDENYNPVSETICSDEGNYTNKYEYDESGKLTSKTTHFEDETAFIRYNYDENGNETVYLHDFSSFSKFGNCFVSREISEEQAQNIMDRGLLSYGYTIQAICASGLMDLDDEQWAKIEKFMGLTGNGQINLQYLCKIAALSDSEIEEAYNMLCEDETATTESVYTKIKSKQKLQDKSNDFKAANEEPVEDIKEFAKNKLQ